MRAFKAADNIRIKNTYHIFIQHKLLTHSHHIGLSILTQMIKTVLDNFPIQSFFFALYDDCSRFEQGERTAVTIPTWDNFAPDSFLPDN